MTAPVTDLIHTQAWFHDASTAYEEAMVVYRDSQESVADARSAVYSARERLKDLEAAMLVNGGAGQWVIGTGDAKRREAVLRLALRDDESYQVASKELQRLERALDRAEAGRDNAANQMSLQKRRMDAYLSAANLAAATRVLDRDQRGRRD